MSGFSTLQPDPGVIGGVSKAPFVLLPDPQRLFVRRAARFEALAAADRDMAPYLSFLSGVALAQARVDAALPPSSPVGADRVARATANAMPPLDRYRMADDEALADTMARFLETVAELDKPAAASRALDALLKASPETRSAALGGVLTESIDGQDLATVLFLSAGLQVHATRLASTLPAASLQPVGTGICPACGGRPVASIVVGFQGAEGARYGVCSLCATQWNEVRVKCLPCGSTKGVGYREVASEGQGATVKAEVCDECRSWLKIMYGNRNPSLDALADDIGSVALDLMMRETDYRRAGFDPFLLGY